MMMLIAKAKGMFLVSTASRGASSCWPFNASNEVYTKETGPIRTVVGTNVIRKLG